MAIGKPKHPKTGKRADRDDADQANQSDDWSGRNKQSKGRDGPTDRNSKTGSFHGRLAQPRAGAIWPRGRQDRRAEHGGAPTQALCGDQRSKRQPWADSQKTRKRGHAAENRKHQCQNRIATDSWVTHNLQLAFAGATTTNAIGAIGKAILVKRTGQDNQRRNTDDGRDQRGSADEHQQGRDDTADQPNQCAAQNESWGKTVGRHYGIVHLACQCRQGQAGGETQGPVKVKKHSRHRAGVSMRRRGDKANCTAARSALGRRTLLIIAKLTRDSFVPTATGLPFDDVRALFEKPTRPDLEARSRAALRNANLLKPTGSLGKLEEIALFLASWQRTEKPMITRPVVALFAGNHGVHAQGVSKWPMEVTQTMVDMFMQGGAAINQLCALHGLGLKVFDLALDLPVADFTQEPAMDEKGCAATIAFGMEAIAGGVDLICLGEMGIANTTAASAIYAALFGGDVEDWVGDGAGSDPDQTARKVAAIKVGLERHAASLHDPLEVLRCFGGREIAAMAGTILSARAERIPVLVDGFVATASAVVLYKIDPSMLDHCLFSHVSAEKAHRKALEAMQVEPLLDLGMRLGEGTGAALGAMLVKSAASTHSGMATFVDVGFPEVTSLPRAD